jgi:hypothetical protein
VGAKDRPRGWTARLEREDTIARAISEGLHEVAQAIWGLNG